MSEEPGRSRDGNPQIYDPILTWWTQSAYTSMRPPTTILCRGGINLSFEGSMTADIKRLHNLLESFTFDGEWIMIGGGGWLGCQYLIRLNVTCSITTIQIQALSCTMAT